MFVIVTWLYNKNSPVITYSFKITIWGFRGSKRFSVRKKLIEPFSSFFLWVWLPWHLIRTVNAILCSCFENFPFRNCHLRIKCLYLSTSLTLHLLSTIIWEHFLFSSCCLLMSFSLFNSFIINTILW